MTTPSTKKRRRPRPIASILIRDAGALDAVGRRSLGAWMRRQAANVEKHGTVYAVNFKARYR